MSSSTAPATRLLPVLGLLFGVAVSVGGTLGVGILRQPGPVASYLREPWLIMFMWFGGAAYAAVGAANVSELATMLPRAGGFYVFAREAMGDRVGFAVGWSDFLANIAATSYAASAAVEFLGRLVPGVAPFGSAIAATLVLSFAALQWFGIRISGRVQQIASAIAAVALLVLIAGCFLAPAPAGTAAAMPVRTGGFIAAVVLAIQSIVVTYDGWYEPIYFAEETRHATRHLPRAIFGGLAVVTTIYLLLNGALLHALGAAGLAASKFAAADAARKLFGPASEILISIIAIVILLTLLHTLLMSSTRILFAVSRDGLFWRRGGTAAENGTPQTALLLATAVALALVITGSVDRLIAMAGFFYVANYCWAYISLIVLRRAQPAAPRPFRVFGYPFVTAVVLAASLAFLAGAILDDRANSLYALLLLLASFPVRWLAKAASAIH